MNEVKDESLVPSDIEESGSDDRDQASSEWRILNSGPVVDQLKTDSSEYIEERELEVVDSVEVSVKDNTEAKEAKEHTESRETISALLF